MISGVLKYIVLKTIFCVCLSACCYEILWNTVLKNY